MHGQGPFEYNQYMSQKYAFKKKGKTKLGILVLSLIIFLLLVGQMVNTGRSFFKPWNASKITKNYNWDGRFNINLVLKAKEVAVLTLNPTEKQAIIINFPDNTLVDVANGFGQWEIRSVYNLGGWGLLEQTISDFLGIPIDGFIGYEGSITKINPVDLIQMNIQSSLTPVELIRLKFYLAQVRFDKIKNIDLGKRSVLDLRELNDSTTVYIADPIKIDSVLTFFVDPTIKNEHMTIAVFNATDYPQLAQKAARLITSLGGNVIITANAQRNYLKTQVVGEKSATLTRLQQIFDLGCRIDPKCDKIGPGVEEERAQINVILGEDFYKGG